MTCRQATFLILLLCMGQISLAQGNAADTLRIARLQDTALRFISRPGSEPSDFDSAYMFIEKAYALSIKPSVPPKWRLFCIQYKGWICLEKEDWVQAKKILTEVADDFARIGEVYKQAHCYALYGKYLNNGEAGIPDKLAMLEKAASLYRSVHAYSDMVDVSREVAYTHFEQKRTDLAVAELLFLLEECRKHKLSMITSVHDLLSTIEKFRGNYNLALAYGLASIKACEEFKVKSNMPLHYLEVAKVYYMLENYEEGIRWHVKCNEAFLRAGSHYIYIESLSLVDAMIKLKRAGEALQMVLQTEKEMRPKDGTDSQCVFLCKAMCYHALKQYNKAQHYFVAMAGIEPEVHNVFVYRFTSMAEYYYEVGAYTKSKKYAHELLNVSELFLTPANKSYGYYLLFKADSALGNAKDALHYLSRHKALSDSIFTDRKEKQTRELLVQYETEKKEKDLQLKAQSIDLLEKNAYVQQLNLGKAKANRNLAFSIAGLLVVITALLLNQYRLNRRNTRIVDKKNETLEGLVRDKDRLLTEKVWLLKEVHHRVKNNLQTVLSLLESQSYFVNKEVLPAIRDSQNRVYAMSLIHKKLYQSDEVTAINMEQYLKELVQYLRESLSDDRSVVFLLDIDAVELDVSQAVPIGLIVNEAVTNSVKYAFTHSKGRNEVSITMKTTTDHKTMLTIADNGKGMPVTNKKDDGLGMRLMRGLSEDINGTFVVTGDNGVRVSIGFVANTLLLHAEEITAG